MNCANGCPPGTDLRTCMLAFMGECPVIKCEDGDLFYNPKEY